MSIMNDRESNPLYPFTILNDIGSLFRDDITLKDLDNMIYDAFEGNNDDDTFYFNLDSIEFHAPLSNYIFDMNNIPYNNNCLKLRSYNIRSIPKRVPDN